jgi:lambda family phage portal protein
MSSRILKQFLQARPGGYEQAAGRAGLNDPASARVIPLHPPHRRNYAAAQISRLTEGWSTLSLSANASLQNNLDALRGRSRALCRDNDYARKFCALVAANVIGPYGFGLEGRIYDDTGLPDKSANDAVEAAWSTWVKRGTCDVTGKHSLRDLCHLAIKSAARDGEFLIRLVRGSSAGNAFGLSLQLLDVNRIDTGINRSGSQGENAIRMGIEIDAFSRPTAYHLRATMQGDSFSNQRGGDFATQRIPASEIVHGFVADLPEQVRGVPWLHASMSRLNHLGSYEESAVIASRIGASKMGFFTTGDGQAEISPDALATGTDANYDAPMIDVEAGSFQTLPPGTNFQNFDPDYPAAQFGEFVKANLRGIASGLGVAYHSLANDLEGVSFSSIRSGTLEERDGWSVLQQWFIDALLEPIYSEWLRNSLAFGLITLPARQGGAALPLAKLEKFSGHIFQPRRWEWVDPLRDIQADREAIEAGLKSPQDVAAGMGRNLEDVLTQIKAAQDLAKSLGVSIDWLRLNKPGAAPGATAPPPDVPPSV